MIYTLEWIKAHYGGIHGSWNGEDDRFLFEGDVYTEDDVQHADEILKKVAELEELLKE